MSAEILTVSGRPVPLDLLLFRRFRREVPGLVEATYARDPGLADLGPLLPVGTAVAVEALAPPPAAPARRLVRLFE